MNFEPTFFAITSATAFVTFFFIATVNATALAPAEGAPNTWVLTLGS